VVEPSDLLRWIPLLPLAAAAAHGGILGLLRRPAPRGAVVLLGCGSVLASFLLTLAALWQLIGVGGPPLVDGVYTWIGAGRFSAEVSFLLDPLSAVMALLVTGVGFLVHVYSVGYLDDDHREDKGFQRFFVYLNLFTAAMLVLVLADNLLLLFLGWEGVGLCSYLLIGFWYGDRWNARCGSKAFIVNRIGDVGMLLGIFLLYATLSEVLPVERAQEAVVFRKIEASFSAISGRLVTLPEWLSFLPGFPEWKLATVIGLCFFLGAAGKSAQGPLFVWLPDAMAGPTPVSALIHAATMVTAGVYLVCRLSFLYVEAPGASAVVAWTGAGTALFAALVATAQDDIKKVLAYSTVSQLGLMFVAAGAGGFAAAIFHLLMHGFFKALLFLGAGAVILVMHHQQDIRKMGGLAHVLPWWGPTHVCFLVGVLAITGAPGLSGFFSKDEVLLAAHAAEGLPGHAWILRLGLLTTVLTAYYMFRLHFLVFFGRSRVPPAERRQVREPPPSVTVPLVVLALLSVFGGYAGLPQLYGDWLAIPNSDSLRTFLSPVLARAGDGHAVQHDEEVRLALSALAAAALGATAAWLSCLRYPALAARARRAVPQLRRTLANGFWLDRGFQLGLVQPLHAFSERVLWRGIDAGLIDGVAVMGSARLVQASAREGLRRMQSGLAQSYLVWMLLGAAVFVGLLLR